MARRTPSLFTLSRAVGCVVSPPLAQRSASEIADQVSTWHRMVARILHRLKAEVDAGALARKRAAVSTTGPSPPMIWQALVFTDGETS